MSKNIQRSGWSFQKSSKLKVEAIYSRADGYCRLQKSRFVVDIIVKRGYKPLFMPPYSPFLNPIEECWSKIKSGIRRNPLKKDDELTPRIAEACNTVTTKDCLQ